MSAAGAWRASRVSAGVALLAVGAVALAGCQLGTPALDVTRPGLVRLSGRPSVLVIISDRSSGARRELRRLLSATARVGEQLIVLNQETGAVVVASAAPKVGGIRSPSRPAPLRGGATTFQKSQQAAALRQYRMRRREARSAVQARERRLLAAWAVSVAAEANSRLLVRSDASGHPVQALTVAADDLSGLGGAGLDIGNRKVIAILGDDFGPAGAAPPSMGLQGSTVVIASRSGGSSGGQAAAQAALSQAGAARVVLLPDGTQDQLVPAVRQGLDGSVTDVLSSLLFRAGAAALQPAAIPQLRQLLRLLTVAYPQAVATIDGYTDDLPVPGGNLTLSRLRARTVQAWLVANGVSASRLQSIGFGDADPVAPNTPQGQPLNRRVVVVIDPVARS